MPVGPGATLGPYQIIAVLGAGGMGEVYRARDPRLSRDVAIKILRSGPGDDLERIRRFETEARAIAALNHPHICTVFDVGVHDGMRFLVMELVAGETLASIIARGAMPIAQAVDIAAAIAAGLDCAHRAGIVHRDLKPANVMVNGASVKLLDFGLAKLRSTHAGGDSVTQPAGDLTAAGVIAGTIPYMAPEQVEGAGLDARTDIWALGCVMYEMLTGQRAFAAASPAAVLGAILRDTPLNVRAIVPESPQALEQLIRTCFERAPDDRWQSAGDLARQLRHIAARLNAQQDQAHAFPARPPTARQLLIGGSVVAATAVLVMGYVSLKRVSPSPAAIHAQIPVQPAEATGWPVGPEQRASSGRPSRTAIALSPDGTMLVFVGVQGQHTQLYLRRFEGNSSVAVAGTEDADAPFFSPDSRRIGFWSAGALRWASTTGGPVQTIAAVPRPLGASWGADDTILLGSVRGILAVKPGAAVQQLTTLNPKLGETSHAFPRRIPGSENLIFTVLLNFDPREARVVSRRPGAEPALLLDNASDARIVDGYLVALRWGTLIAAPFDAEALRAGPVTTVLDGVMYAGNMTNSTINTGAGQVSIADGTGHLAYLEGGPYPQKRDTVGWFDRAGTAIASLPLDESRAMFFASLSSGGRIAGYHSQRQGGPIIYDARRQAATQLGFDGRVQWPLWTPDGQYVIFLGWTKGALAAIYRMHANGGAPAESLTDGQSDPNPATISPDGAEVLFEQNGDVFKLRISDRSIQPLLSSPAAEIFPSLSPDGRWLAYSSNDSGRFEVYVSPYPSLTGRRQVSSNRGASPVWSRGGRELLYVEPTGPPVSAPITDTFRLMTAAITSRGEPSVPRALFHKSTSEFGLPIGGPPAFAVTPEGDRLLAGVPDPARYPPPSHINVVFNWVDSLRRRMQRAAP